MRLIDADEAIKKEKQFLESDDEFEKEVADHVVAVLSCCSTVEAIPVSWLKEHLKKAHAYNGLLDRIIKEWEDGR